jgi:hypothetical protein
MTDVELNERIRLDGAEDAERKLTKLSGAAERLSRGFGAVASVGGTVAGIAGAWKIGEAISQTDKLYQAVSRVKSISGMAAENAHAMFDMFELSGIEMEGAENIMMGLTRLTERMGGALSGSTEQAADLRRLMTRLGISIKVGPEERLYQMANAAQKGKLRIQDLIKAFQIPRGQASEMMEMLTQGSGRLKQIKAETMTSGDLITENALQRHKEMLQVRRELGDAWGGLVGTLYKNLLPGVTAVLKEIQSGFKALEPITERVGRVLADNMGLVVGLAKTYLALMLAAKAANAFAPGPSMGIFARGRQLVGGANRMMAGKSAAAGGMDYFAAKAANPGIGMFASAGGPMLRILSTVVGRLGVIGIVISIVVAAFELLRRNVFGIRDVFVSVLGPLISKMKSIAMMVFGVLEKLFEAIKPILAILGGALLVTLLMFAWWMDKLMWVMEKVMMGIVALVNGVIWAINQIPGVDIGYIDLEASKKAEKKADAGTRSAAAAPGNTVNQDFRGSKFEIQNNFPEGIDAGRVAVAVGDELASLGERRLDSGLRPIFSYR